MDLRVKKTRANIINSFLMLRSQKPLERITVKELSDAAQINKATFYLHYKDIYDLSEMLENQLFENVFNSIENPDAVLLSPKTFVKELVAGFIANQTLIDIIFSDDRSNILVDRIEKKLKEFLFEKYPEYKDVAKINILLTYSIKGGFYAFAENMKYDTDKLISVISDIAEYITKQITAVKRD